MYVRVHHTISYFAFFGDLPPVSPLISTLLRHIARQESKGVIQRRDTLSGRPVVKTRVLTLQTYAVDLFGLGHEGTHL